MNDPWAGVRVTKALETIEEALGYDGSSIVTIGSVQYLALKDGARIIEDDLDALLAVVRAAQRLGPCDGTNNNEIREALAALPEHLRGETNA